MSQQINDFEQCKDEIKTKIRGIIQAPKNKPLSELKRETICSRQNRYNSVAHLLELNMDKLVSTNLSKQINSPCNEESKESDSNSDIADNMLDMPIYSYNPSDPAIIDEYQLVSRICDEKLSSTYIELVNRISDGAKVIKKVTEKCKLFSDDQLFNARNEYAIHQMLHHENILQLIDYTETEAEIISYLEFCNDAEFLERTILEQKKEIKDEQLLKCIAQ